MLLHDMMLNQNQGAISLSHITTVTSAVSTITIPSETQDGDFLLLYDLAGSSGAFPTLITPSGFTQLGATTMTGFFVRVAINARIAEAALAGTSLSCMNGNSSNRKLLSLIRPSKAITAFTSSSFALEAPGAPAPANQTVTSSSISTFPAMVWAHYQGSAPMSAARGFSPSEDLETGDLTGNTAIARYKFYNTGSAVDHTISKDDDGTTNSMASGYFTFSF